MTLSNISTPHFDAFLERNHIDPNIYINPVKIHRYIMINLSNPITQGMLEDELGMKLTPSEYHDKILYLPEPIKMCDIKAYQKGHIFSMDVSSFLAVLQLDLQPDDHLLDMCCAPGSKLCVAASIIGVSGNGSVTGVDISKARLYNAVAAIKKYAVKFGRLFHIDSRLFNIGVLNIISKENLSFEVKNSKIETIKLNKSKKFPDSPFYCTSALRKYPCIQQKVPSYSKILLDVECTHDGSVKHIFKALNGSAKERQMFDSYFTIENEKRVIYNQRALIRHAFSLLSNGGIMVYCTCSLTPAQNEEVIENFLEDEPNAVLQFINIPNSVSVEIFPNSSNSAVTMGNAARFDPRTGNSSGFFIAKIIKTAN